MQRFAGDPLASLRGQTRDRLLANPAAGADASLTLPSGYQYRVLLASWTFTASAQVATRKPGLVLRDGDGNLRFEVLTTLGVEAGKKVFVSGAEGQSTQGFSANEWGGFPTPELLIPAGWSIATLTAGIQTEDLVTGVRLLLEELSDDYPATAAGVAAPPTVELDLEVARHA